jgi:hypothetical protein
MVWAVRPDVNVIGIFRHNGFAMLIYRKCLDLYDRNAIDSFPALNFIVLRVNTKELDSIRHFRSGLNLARIVPKIADDIVHTRYRKAHNLEPA